jgi:hypothetical protein
MLEGIPGNRKNFLRKDFPELKSPVEMLHYRHQLVLKWETTQDK